MKISENGGLLLYSVQIRKHFEEAEKIKAAMAADIKKHINHDYSKTFIITFSQLDATILSAQYYNTGAQLSKIVDYILHKPYRSLNAISTSIYSIIDKGQITDL